MRWRAAVGVCLSSAASATVIACFSLGDLQGGEAAGDAGDALDALVTLDAAAASHDAASSVDGLAAVVDAALDALVIDPMAAPDGFEASGPPPPPTCATAGFACAVVAPAGWTGPFGLYEGNLASAPSCGAVTQVLTAYSGLAGVTAATCPACTCDAATGTGCAKVPIEGARGGCFGTGTGNGGLLTSGACEYWSYGTLIDPDGYAANGVKVGKPAVTGGSCAPTVAKPTPSKPGYTWNMTAIACTTQVPSTSGCTAGRVCSKTPEPPFNAKLCIAKDGDIAGCPGAPYSNRALYYKAASDTRDCGTCGCGAPNAAQCDVTALSSADNCATARSAGTCLYRANGTDPDTAYYLKATATPPTVTCPASGGAPTGTVTPSNPVTICCEP